MGKLSSICEALSWSIPPPGALGVVAAGNGTPFSVGPAGVELELLAGEGLMGVIIAIIAVVTSKSPMLFSIPYKYHWMSEIISALAFTGLGFILYNIAIRCILYTYTIHLVYI